MSPHPQTPSLQEDITRQRADEASLFSSCAGLSTSQAALRGLPVLSLQPHTCGAPELNCNVSSTKRLSLYSISTSALQGRGLSVLHRNLLLQASLVERLPRV